MPQSLAQYQPYLPYIIIAVNGLIAGWLAGLLFGGKGLFGNLIIGILGAFVGALALQYTGFKLPFDFNTIVPVYGNQIAVSTVGAIIVVILGRILFRS